ncbi:hypothetical protein B296_00048443 [Ensete ventricosum]|uniref:DUF632 domain-containing protein n=1 Tax=Ensete ventricosum TaxID=4639 RepID=A0A426XZT2_ENSVE|nr:hypothetical protein B296_00048443 [Ensete ventricosum]
MYHPISVPYRYRDELDTPVWIGHIDHSVRVMRVITWHRSFEVTPGADGSKDDFIDDEWETHATVLDKILAWEKRLYDEVKLMKIEYHRKVALLNREKKRSASGESLQRTKAATLVHAWHEYLEKLPEELPNTALLSFSAVLNTIAAVQQEELKQKERCREIHKEYLGKKRAFEDCCQKHSQKRMGEREIGGEEASQNDPVREKSLVALKTHLPELFRAVSDFAEFCSNTYTSLQLVTDQQDPPTK